MDQLLVSETRTDVVYPRLHTNSRTEFHFQHDLLFDADIRLGNIGCITDNANEFYTLNNGVTSLIKNIYLLNGSDQIDICMRVNELMAFKNTTKSNAENINMTSQLLGTMNGYYTPEATSGGVIESVKYTLAGKNADIATNDPNTTFYGLLHLKQVFDFLRQSRMVNTKVLRNLRLVIEWNVNPYEIFGGDIGALNGIAIISPEVYIDRLMNVPYETIPNNFSVQYDTTELEIVSVGTSQAFKTRINNFNNKFLNRCVIVNRQPADAQNTNTTSYLKANSSSLQTGEQYSIFINNRNLFDLEGIDTSARKMQHTVDAWGDLNIPWGSWDNTIAQADAGNVVDTTAGLDYNVAKLSYGGFIVGDRVSELKFNLTRSNADVLEVLFYGEVVKVLESKDGVASLRYL